MYELDGAPGGALGAAAEARRAVTGVSHQLGRRWLQEHAHQQWSLKRWSQEVDEDGNMLQPRSSTNTERSCSFTEAEPQSTGEVTGWSRCRNGLCPNEVSHGFRLIVPCCVVETSPTPFASIGIVRTSRCAGAKGVRTGKRDSQSLQGSWRQSHNQHHGP